MPDSRPNPGSVTCVALLRGINVGKAKRIAMADLREIVSGLGHHQVRTLLNSGNVVFNVGGHRPPDCAALAATLHEAIATKAGVNTSVTVVTASALDAIVRANPWPEAALQPSQLLVAFAPNATSLAGLEPLSLQTSAPDRFALTSLAAYAWCASGILESPLGVALLKACGGIATTRNWATVCKLHDICQG